VLSEDELKRALRRVPLIGADGPFHRFVDLWFVHQNLAGGRKTEVLAGLGAKMLGGRFTPRGTFETLYVATTAATARIEAESRITASGVVDAPSKPYVHFVVRGRLQKVLDLTDTAVLATLKTTEDEMTGPWIMGQVLGDEAPPTQILGRVAHAIGRIEAILFPSSKDKPDGRCLAVLPDRVKRGSWLEIVDETGLVEERLP
jgi:RES domain-containing protein